jgi:hypothetical protein
LQAFAKVLNEVGQAEQYLIGSTRAPSRYCTFFTFRSNALHSDIREYEVGLHRRSAARVEDRASADARYQRFDSYITD